MHVAHLSLHDFRSWRELEIDLAPGVTTFVGRNGQGKTNIVEAVDYLSSLSSHRVANDAPLVHRDADQAIVRAAVVRDGRQAVLEIEINPGRSNRGRINRSPLPRARELLGLVKTVVFSPDDLKLVKGDPSHRRRFLDDLLVQLAPKYAGTRADYERVLRQRNSLLKGSGRRGPIPDDIVVTLAVWDDRLVELGTEITFARWRLIDALQPHIGEAYAAVARGAHRDDAHVGYRPSVPPPSDPTEASLKQAFVAELEHRRRDEFDRGLTLVGPHRDEMVLDLGGLPVKGYASHGESWSFALALRLASYRVLASPDVGEGDDPILILDDVFAELDAGRRDQLAAIVADAEQVLITAAVGADVPEQLQGRRYLVVDGEVRDDR